MIRYALAFLGLSAGAVSAQPPMQAASVSDYCGPHIEVLADGAACHDASPASKGTSSPEAPLDAADAVVPVRAPEQRGTVAADTGAGKGFAALKRGMDMPDGARRPVTVGLHPYDRAVRFAGTLDGSDPSAMFCP